MKFNIKNKLIFLLIIIFLLLLIVMPDISTITIKNSINLCAGVIFPSLFPFTVCVLTIIKYNISINNRYINLILFKIFGQNFHMFFVFLLSLLGGYPIGIKLINQLEEQKIINNKSADLMSMFCVNAGPTFILSVIGYFLSSKKIGIILLISNTLSAFVIALICSKKLKCNLQSFKIKKVISVSLTNSFISSVNDAIDTLVKICSIVIIFSIINAYLDYFLFDLPIIKNISLLTEISAALSKTKNIYVVSFLLGFGGFSVWGQIYVLTINKNRNYKIFILGRILHSTLNVIFTIIITKFLKTKISTFSNGVYYKNELLYSNYILTISIAIMLIVLIASINSKNNSGKIIKDMI